MKPKTLRGLVSRNKKRFQEDGFDLDLSYISNQIIAMGFPAQHLEGVYRNHIDDVVRFLQTRHADHYKIFHLCDERDFNVCRFDGPVVKYPFRDHNPPKFEQIIALCEDAYDFLKQDPQNVVAINCKAGKGRTGVMACSCLLRLNNTMDAESALRHYAERRTDDGRGVTIPSQRRYVHYYSQLLANKWTYNETPLYLTAININGIHPQTGLVLDVQFLKYECEITPPYSKNQFLLQKAGENLSIMTNNSNLLEPPYCQLSHHANCSDPPNVNCTQLSTGKLNQQCKSISDSSVHVSDRQNLSSTKTNKVLTYTLSSVPVHGKNILIQLDRKVLFVGDVRMKITAKQHLISKKLCHFWFNTFFVVHTPDLVHSGKFSRCKSNPSVHCSNDPYKPNVSRGQKQKANTCCNDESLKLMRMNISPVRTLNWDKKSHMRRDEIYPNGDGDSERIAPLHESTNAPIHHDFSSPTSNNKKSLDDNVHQKHKACSNSPKSVPQMSLKVNLPDLDKAYKGKSRKYLSSSCNIVLHFTHAEHIDGKRSSIDKHEQKPVDTDSLHVANVASIPFVIKCTSGEYQHDFTSEGDSDDNELATSDDYESQLTNRVAMNNHLYDKFDARRSLASLMDEKRSEVVSIRRSNSLTSYQTTLLCSPNVCKKPLAKIHHFVKQSKPNVKRFS